MKKIFLSVLCIVMMILSLCGCSNTEETYASIKKEIELTEKLESDYFAQYYDMKRISKAKENAEQAIEDSNEEVYNDVLAELQTQNETMMEYIQAERDKLYNVQTNKDVGSKYPFAFNIEELPIGWFAEPLTKPTSSHPSRIDILDSGYSDIAPYACIWIDSSSREYDYNIRNIDTKEICVENENGEIEKALVNTEIQFKQRDRNPVNKDKYRELKERPAYFMENKNGDTILALQNYDGKDFYVLYGCYVNN